MLNAEYGIETKTILCTHVCNLHSKALPSRLEGYLESIGRFENESSNLTMSTK